MATVQDLAYAAGIFDGEGTVDIQDRARMAVKMTDRETVGAMKDILGGRIYQWKDTKTGRRTYEWRAAGVDGMLEAIDSIIEYSRAKSRQLEVAKSFYSYKEEWGHEKEVKPIASKQLRALREPVVSCVTFDLETMGLEPIMENMLTASVMVDTRESEIISFIKMPDADGDKQLAIDTRNYLELFAFSLGWNSARFDVHFLNTRLLINGERPAFLGSHTSADVPYDRKFGNKRRTSLVDAANHLKVTDEEQYKTPIDWPTWHRANDGDADAMNYVADHGEKDVVLTKRIWDAINN